MESPTTFSFSDMLAWVEHQTGAVVNFQDTSGITREIPLLHLIPNQYIHRGPYCEFAKNNGHLRQCMLAKDRADGKALGGKPFASVCPLGLWDFVQPVFFRGKPLGVFFLGSLRTGKTLPPVHGRVYRGPAIPAATATLRRTLQQWAQYLKEIALLIVAEWIRAGHPLTKQKPLEFYRDVTNLYIQNHYHEHVRLEDLARQLHLHPFYLGKIIRRACGRNFRTLLMEYRINKAGILLRAGGKTITQVAYASGFNDSNYFSTVFRRATGQSPRCYCKLKGVQ